MNTLRLLLSSLKIALMLDFAYPLHLFFQMIESSLSLAINFFWLAMVFSKVQRLSGWSAPQLLILLGSHSFVRGLLALGVQPAMRLLMEDVRTGNLDFLLLKPANSQLLASLRELRLIKIVDVAFGLTLIIVGACRLQPLPDMLQICAFALMMSIGITIIYAFWFGLASLSFWLIRARNIDVIFLRLYQTARWPLEIYPRWLALILTFVVPVAYAVVFPSRALAGMPIGESLLLSILFGTLVFTISRGLWVMGLRNYTSTSGE